MENWIYDTRLTVQKRRALTALEKAKANESSNKSKKWYRLDSRTLVFTTEDKYRSYEKSH